MRKNLRNKLYNGSIYRFVVHVYRVSGVDERGYTSLAMARSFCYTMFASDRVYKVKLWDLEKGPIVPNNPNARGLVLELK